MLGRLRIILKKKWSEIEEQWEEVEGNGGNPFDIWNAFLEEYGLVRSVSCEWNWNEEWGVPHLVNNFYQMCNSKRPVYVIEAPDTGSNMSSTLFFDREILKKKLAI